MLHLHQSPHLDVLADALADVFRTPGADPIAPEWVVVSARAQERWLTDRLAERLGVCAHVRFLSPSTLLEELIERALGKTRADVRAWRPERLTWRLLAALPALRDDPSLGRVRDYLTRGAAGEDDVVGARALAFAQRMGDCFARYAAVDPTRVLGWDDAPASGDDDWQPVLWRALRAGADEAPAHPAALADAAEAHLRAHGAPAGIPDRLVWIAQPGTPALHVRTIVALAAAGVTVHALLPLPAPDASATPRAAALRRSLGRLGDDLGVLVERACAELQVVPVHVTPRALPDRSSTALGVLRDAVLAPSALAAPVPLAGDDASLRVHACHGPMRQAEVLRDELLALLDADATLRPRDILVLTPDIALTAPLVEAAFAATGGAAPLPLRVLDRPARRANPVADVVLRVLELSAGRVSAVDVLDLVTMPAVGARFGLDEGTEEILRRWTRESGVRWGLDASDRADAHALPPDEEHTWRFGLERLLLGWGLPGDGRLLWGGALPLDAVEGGEAERLGRFAEACARLFDAVRAVRRPQTLPAWRETLRAIANALVDDDVDLVLAHRAWRDALDALVEDGAPCTAPVDAGAVRLTLAARVAESAVTEGAAGAVTLAALRPGRVVPARVIALLGLDDGAWPRPRGGAGFDLLARERIAGAADGNAEDRQRLLEAVVGARDRLLVLYTGRTLDTNDPVAPAVPVGELLDALDARATRADGARDAHGALLPARTLVECAHPLQPFGQAAFGGTGERPHSHDATHLAGARALRGARVDAPGFLTRALSDPVERTVTVDALASFLAAPAQTFVAERLRVRLGAPESLDVDDPLELDGLGAWALRSDLLARLLDDGEDGGDATRTLALQRAAGRLPHGPLGELAFAAAMREARAVRHLAHQRTGMTRTDGVDVDRTLGAWRLVGRVGPLFDGGLFDVQAGRVNAKQLLACWVRHLALHLADAAGSGAPTSRIVGLPDDKGAGAVHTFAPVDDAAGALTALLDLYGRAMCEPLPLLPESAREYAQAFTPRRTPEDAHAAGIGAAVKKWRDRPDAYAQRLFGDDPFGDGTTFAELARTVWTPVLACTGARTEVDA